MGFKEQLTSLMANRKFLIVLALTTIFIIVAIYTYKTYISPRLNAKYVANKEYINSENVQSDTADLYMFSTAWCPHCKKAKPEWEKLKSIIGENPVNNVRINFVEVDCDKDTATADKFNVKGYPTIKLVHGNQVIEYDAKPNVDTLQQFLSASL